MTKKIDKTEELENRINDLEAQLKRAVADYQNLEKRISEGRSELTKWGTSELLVKILPVLDHLDQALTGASETDKQSGWFKGVEMAVKEFNQVLQAEGLGEIQADGVFNPSLHEALDTEVGEENKILKVVKKGYNLNGKVLRPAGVVVGKNPVTLSEAKQSSLEDEEIAASPTAPRNDEEEKK